ncbi:MAG: serine hydrolase [FCB group bacterium]|nr:serine hydrolase [FCB group bacterium]
MSSRTILGHIFIILAVISTMLVTGCGKKGLKYAPLEIMLQDAIADSAWPGAVMLIGRGDEIVFYEAVGYHTYEKLEPVTKDDIFDLASMSKAVGTTSAVMKLIESGKLKLDDPASAYLPQLHGPDPVQTAIKKNIRVRHLLAHTAGFEPFRLFYHMDVSQEARWDSVFQSPLLTKPGDKTLYSDIGLMVLGKVVESVAGMPLDRYLEQQIFAPLGMRDTYYNPPASLLPRIVPTEINAWHGGLVHGFVHDENTYSLGGVAGHAGLFSTAGDLSRFSRMMLNGGELEGTRVFKPQTVEMFTRPVSRTSSRCLGWDSPEGECSGGIYVHPHSYGHTGFTGTSIWIDPENKVYVILLTNAVHPDRDYKHPKYFDWRQLMHSAAYEELGITVRNRNVILKQRWREHFGRN